MGVLAAARIYKDAPRGRQPYGTLQHPLEAKSVRATPVQSRLQLSQNVAVNHLCVTVASPAWPDRSPCIEVLHCRPAVGVSDPRVA